MAAIDATTLRLSFDRAANGNARQPEIAFLREARLGLGQIAGPAGGTDIPAARAFPELFVPKGG